MKQGVADPPASTFSVKQQSSGLEGGNPGLSRVSEVEEGLPLCMKPWLLFPAPPIQLPK